MRAKHTPIRTCVACRTGTDKRRLLRVVRAPDGVVAYDASGKLNGRGAYICANSDCIALARKQKKLDRSIKSTIEPAVYDELLAQATVPSLSKDTAQ